ncbi:MAG: 2-hydroxy-3-oxopropionate reductase, partial [Devosia sp.]|nr:2-hydroxy-3-oxopropionate reductase [Devosia sp.]
MTTVGIVGLGMMGRGVAANLLRAGFSVVGFDSDQSAVSRLETIGGTGAPSLAELGQLSDHVMIIVMTGQQVLAVVDDENGVSVNMRPGTLLTVMSTVGRATMTTVADICARHALSLIDAPITGGPQAAEDGTLTMIVAGDEDTLARADATFRAISARRVVVGTTPGQAQVVKASLQIVVAGTAAVVAEAFSFADAAGIDGAVVSEVLGSSVAASPLLGVATRSMQTETYSGTGSPLSLIAKDMKIVSDVAVETQAHLPVFDLVSDRVSLAEQRFAGEDVWALRKLPRTS